MKKIVIPFVLVFALFFSACNLSLPDIPDNDTTTPEEAERAYLPREINLAFNQNDSLNPFTAKTNLNLSIMPLLYDSLVRINEDYILRNNIARSITVSDNIYTIIINGGIKFSDGSDLGAEDVVYSLNRARQSGYFSRFLTNVSRVSLVNRIKLEITLNSPDVFFPYNLTVPIIKNGSSNSNVPIGSGRFKVDDNSENHLVFLRVRSI